MPHIAIPSNSRVKYYSGSINVSPRGRSQTPSISSSVDHDDDDDGGSSYSSNSHPQHLSQHRQSLNSSRPFSAPSSLNPNTAAGTATGPIPANSATYCYVMDGGGITFRGSSTGNMARSRQREYSKQNADNLRTHTRLLAVKSSIPVPRPASSGAAPKSERYLARLKRGGIQIAQQNRKLEKALAKIYCSKARLAEHGVKTLDTRERWSKRTSIYDVDAPAAAAVGASSSANKNGRLHAPIRDETGVPKSLGVVKCGGCGSASFFGGDGHKVSRASRPNMDDGCTAFYCNAVCQAVDWELNHENMAKQTNLGGRSGMKPTRKANYWVQSGASVKARKMLRDAVDRGKTPDLEAILHEIKVQRLIGAKESKEIAKTLSSDTKGAGGGEDDFGDGHDTAKARAMRHIISGAKHLIKFDTYPEPDVWHGKPHPQGTYREQVAREKHDRFQADTEEINRIQREGNVAAKGKMDKNAQSEPIDEPPPKPGKWKGASKVSLGAAQTADEKKDMYKTVKEVERERDEVARTKHEEGQRIAGRAARSKKLMDSRRGEEKDENVEAANRNGGKRFTIATKNQLPKKEGNRVEFREVPANFNGLDYDATKKVRKDERRLEKPKETVVDKDDDPYLFRQTMDMLKLSR